MLDYTEQMYDKLCKAISSSNYKVVTVKNYILSKGYNDKKIILRHDVDGKAEDAIRMASIENSYDIKSTYYFRKKSFCFKPHIIKKIEDMGHEVGYHYETLNDTDGDFEKAFKLFKKNLDLFRKFCNVESICAHGNPFKNQYNGDIWKKYNFKDLGLVGEAYLSIDFNGCYYISDSGGSWNNLSDTLNLINVIKKNSYPLIYSLIHTNNWTSNYKDWLLNRSHTIVPSFFQQNFNVIKKLYSNRK